MSEKLGPRTFGRDSSQPFLGRDFGHEADYSEEIAREIDDEIRRIVESAHERAREVLTTRLDELQRLSRILIQYETFDAAQFQRLLSGEPPEDVFADTDQGAAAQPPAEQPKREPGRARGIGLPLPGNIASGQPPESPQPG